MAQRSAVFCGLAPRPHEVGDAAIAARVTLRHDLRVQRARRPPLVLRTVRVDHERLLERFVERCELARCLAAPVPRLLQHRRCRRVNFRSAPTVRDAFEIMYYLQRACEIQIDALSAGANGVLLAPQAVAEHAYAQFTRPGREAITKDWPALLRLLDRRGINYRG